MSVAKLPMSMLSSLMSRNRNVRLGPGSTMSVSFRYTRQPPSERPASVPPNPPTHTSIDMLRTRGTIWPLYGPVVGLTVDRSAGHFQMPTAVPQYLQSGLFLMSRSTSQFEGLAPLKSISPQTHT